MLSEQLLRGEEDHSASVLEMRGSVCGQSEWVRAAQKGCTWGVLRAAITGGL